MTRPANAAEWLGVPRWTFKKWMRANGEPYDSLRAQVRQSLAHLKVKLQNEVARRSPEKALRDLHARAEQAEEGRSAPRPYSPRSGTTVVRQALPYLVERVADERVPVDALSPIEQAAREFRHDLIVDQGGRDTLTAARLAVVNAAVGSWIVLSSLDHYLFELAGSGGLVNRRKRVAFGVVEQRARLADSLTRQLEALGLDRAGPKAMDLNTYLAERYSGPNGNADTEKES